MVTKDGLESKSDQLESMFIKIRDTTILATNNAGECLFNLQDAVAIISQAKAKEKGGKISGAILGMKQRDNQGTDRSRRIQRTNDNTNCKGCHRRGHWWNVDEKCREKMYKKCKLMEQY